MLLLWNTTSLNYMKVVGILLTDNKRRNRLSIEVVIGYNTSKGHMVYNII